MYPLLRNAHLLCGALALPALFMYGLSAVQMAHSRWFVMKPSITETSVSLQPGLTDARGIVRMTMAAHSVRGEVAAIRADTSGVTARVTLPGTVHELSYTRSTGAVRVRTSRAGFMGMINRLHHAAGLWPEYLPLQLWGVFVAVVSAATAGLGVTGIWMWWLRRQDRKWGLILLAMNLAFSIGMLLTIRTGN